MEQETIVQDPVNKEAFQSWLSHYITKAFLQGLKEKHIERGAFLRQHVASGNLHQAGVQEGYLQCIQDIFSFDEYEFVEEIDTGASNES